VYFGKIQLVGLSIVETYWIRAVESRYIDIKVFLAAKSIRRQRQSIALVHTILLPIVYVPELMHPIITVSASTSYINSNMDNPESILFRSSSSSTSY
jgi:hypothetical protein